MLLMIIMKKKLLERFTKTNCKRQVKNILELEKVIKRKGDKFYVKLKGYNNSFNGWIDKKGIIQLSKYFPKPNFSGANVKVELDLPSYATKADLKNGTGADTSDFAKKFYLAELKSDVDKLDIDKLKNLPNNLSNSKRKVDKSGVGKVETTAVDLCKLSNVVKNDVVKITEYNKLVKKVNNIKTTDTSDLVKKVTVKQKLLIIIMINILVLTNLIN